MQQLVCLASICYHRCKRVQGWQVFCSLQWHISQAYWEEFAGQIAFHAIGESHGVSGLVGHFTGVVVGAAEASVPQSSTNFPPSSSLLVVRQMPHGNWGSQEGTASLLPSPHWGGPDSFLWSWAAAQQVVGEVRHSLWSIAVSCQVPSRAVLDRLHGIWGGMCHQIHVSVPIMYLLHVHFAVFPAAGGACYAMVQLWMKMHSTVLCSDPLL